MEDDDSTEIINKSDTDKALNQLFTFKDNADFDTKTELSDNQIIDISKAVAYAEIFDLPILKKFVNSYKLHRVSKDRKGRKEVIEAVKHKAEESSEEAKEQVSTRLKQLIGL